MTKKRTIKEKRIDDYMKYMDKLVRGTSYLRSSLDPETKKKRQEEKDFFHYVGDNIDRKRAYAR